MEPEHPKESHRGGAPKGEVEETWYQVQPLTPQGTLLRTPPQELFAAIHSRDAKQKLASYTRINQDHNKKEEDGVVVFSGQQWRQWFDKYRQEKDKKGMGSLRSAVMTQTFNAFRKMSYTCPNGDTITLNEDRVLAGLRGGTASVMYDNDQHSSSKVEDAPKQAHICVVNDDCIEAGLLLKHNGYEPLVLNMANAKTPGGGYKGGSGAQEENLHRRTNLFQHLEDPGHICTSRSWSYPLPPYGAIFSRDVVVIRRGEDRGYEFMHPELLCFLTVAADKKPRTEKNTDDGRIYMQDPFAESAKRKIRMMFEVALDQHIDALVLSAFGCGSYSNPPWHMAKLMQEVISEHGYDRRFSWIVFAILDDHHTGQKHNPDGNYAPFEEVFNQSEQGVESLELWKKMVDASSSSQTSSSL